VEDNTETVSGQGLAAYIQSGNAFIDCNQNGTQDSDEANTSTSADGTFSVVTSCTNYDIVIDGGVNSVTGLTIPYPTIAPKGYTKVSPITTMLTGLDTDEQESLLANLGLVASDLNTDYNNVDDNATVQAKISKIAAIKSYVETAMTTSTDFDAVKTIAKSFSTAIESAKGENDSVDFSKTSVLATLTSSLVEEITKNDSDLATGLNTALETQQENIAKTAVATKETLVDLLKTIENTNATIIVSNDDSISKVSVGSINIGDQNLTLTNGTTFTHSITSSSSTTINDFFNISLTDLNVTKAFDEQTVTLSAEIKDANNEVKLEIDGVKITGTTSTITSTIPIKSNVTITQSGLVSLTNIMGSSATVATKTALSNTDLNVNVESILTALGSSNKISESIDALNTYIQQEGNYTVTLEITGLDTKTVFIPTIIGTIEVK
ncbi:MAG: hypothetical protein U9O56_09450, partial [Campylobacterota bacterium]|nr:hypothetical protein [Campylobacterota bacterium]